MERFNQDRAARLQRIVDTLLKSTSADVAQDDQIPLPDAEIELIVAENEGFQCDAKSFGFRLRSRDRLIGGIKAGHRPPLLREIQGIASLPHSHVERLSWRESARRFDEKRVRLRIETGRRRRQDPI